MPFRFRRSISFGKGLRLNLSKRGVSTSFGSPGATLNVGKRGIRPTLGIPGTGLSFTPSQTNAKSTGSASSRAGGGTISAIVAGIIFIVICFLAICCIGILFINPTPTAPTVTSAPQMNIQNIIASTAASAQTQTMVSAPITNTPVILETPTLFIITIAPSFTPYPSITPFILADQSAPITGSVCSCTSDTLNCSDFSTHKSAQECFDSCMAQGVGDIHKLDQNNDGAACENLP